jgi:hypothetical protein
MGQLTDRCVSRRIATIVTAVTGVALVLSGCQDRITSSSMVPDRHCSSYEDCEAGWVCIEKHCVKACIDAQQCPSKIDDCVTGYCWPVASPTCHTDSECVPPPVCSDVGGEICYAGQCHYVPSVAGLECDDGDICTISDHCDGNRSCVGANVCSHALAGQCVGGDTDYRAFFGDGTCDSSDGSCSFAYKDVSCPNCGAVCLPVCAGVECTPLNGGCKRSGYCDPTGGAATCVYSDAVDGSSCAFAGSAKGICSAGICLTQCTAATQCDDGNPCTRDTCDGGGLCHNTPTTATCAGATDCTTNSQCANGLCVGTPVVDGTECGSRSCTDLKWRGQTCLGGRCTGTTVFADCDDANPCTSDVCESQGGCTHIPVTNGTQCGVSACAGLVWTQPLCADGVCDVRTQNCDDNGSCTTDSCNPVAGCTSVAMADGAECGTRSCNGLNWNRQLCQSGFCADSALVQNCDDSNGCTNDTCNASTGCSHANNSVDCGTCAICSGGSCIYDSTQNGDCGYCQKCRGLGSCTPQSSSEDIKDECPSSGCLTGNCDGAGACGASADPCCSVGCIPTGCGCDKHASCCSLWCDSGTCND